MLCCVTVWRNFMDSFLCNLSEFCLTHLDVKGVVVRQLSANTNFCSYSTIWNSYLSSHKILPCLHVFHTIYVLSFSILDSLSFDSDKLDRNSQDTFSHVHRKPWMAMHSSVTLLSSIQSVDLEIPNFRNLVTYRKHLHQILTPAIITYYAINKPQMYIYLWET